jgi:hypothetical protein
VINYGHNPLVTRKGRRGRRHRRREPDDGTDIMLTTGFLDRFELTSTCRSATPRVIS